jgi:CheY-like chemotaxis protein
MTEVPPEEVSTTEEGVLKGLRVVVCEDEGITQMQLCRILNKAGLVVAGSAVNGKVAVEMALKERPDIILMDISMPVMDGLEAAQMILANYPACIIMLTANNGEEYLRSAREIGAYSYVDKPVSRDVLVPKLVSVWADFKAGKPASF